MAAFRRWGLRFQIGMISVILLATFGMLMALMANHNRRWDLTQEKIYSFSAQTVDILRSLRDAPLEILAFYPSRDDNKTEVEVFLKEAAIVQGHLAYRFYDPQKQPALTRDLRVKDLYTMLLRYKGHEERVVLPDEEAFATALLRLKNPKEMTACVVTGHGESETGDTGGKGISRLAEALKDRNLAVRDILLAAQGIPPACRMVIVPGPQKNWTRDELGLLRKFYGQGGGVFFLMDPTDKEAGLIFYDFMRSLGVRIASNVIVDKMSRAVGGDFLVPFINQYHPDHPLTRDFHDPIFFPVARTVEPIEEENAEVVPVAFSGSNSWAETNLQLLEQGEAVFELDADTPGPLSVVVALTPLDPVKKTLEAPKPKGRMVIAGDSDFMTNAYLDLSANRNFVLRVLNWLAADDRVVRLDNINKDFAPFTLTESQRWGLFMASAVVLPLIFFAAGAAGILWRKTRV